MILNLYLIFLSVILGLHFILKKRYAFWSDRDVPFIKPSFPFGNFKGIGSKIHISEAFVKFYNELKGKYPFGGGFMFTSPIAIITDLDLIKNIFVKDFNYFTSHGIYSNEKDDPMSYNLFTMDGDHWKNLRSKFSPTFTSGKMKMMFPTMAAVGKELIKCVDRELSKSSEIELKSIVGRFTTDIIASCAFGIEVNSLEYPDNQFYTMMRKCTDEPHLRGIKFYMATAFEKLSNKLGIKFNAEDVVEFYTKSVQEIIKYREDNDVKRNDLMNLMLQLKNKGKLDDDETIGKSDFLTTQDIISQSFLFLGAGSDTSSITMSYALNELAEHQNIQQKLRIEIKNVLKSHDGQITYDSLMDMNYLEQVINETLRKYPILPVLNRVTAADYLVPGTKSVIEKGTKVFVPIYAIQRDPEYYPDPENFNPDRFTNEEIQKRHAMTFLSFGTGPRICIGQRFGMMQMKLGLITLLTNYKFTKSDKTKYPIEYSLSSLVFALTPDGGVTLNVEKICE